MKISLKNIGKVREADVEINGITVIAGENDTGKSTVGKALFSVFNGFYEIKKRIKEQKINSVARIILDSIDDIDPMPLEELASLIIEKTDEIKSPQDIFELVPELIRQYDSKIEFSDFSEKEANRLLDVLSISDDEAFLKIMDSRIADEFNGQPNNIYSDDLGEMILTIRNEEAKINILYNNVQDISNMLELKTEAVYIDDPFVVDEITNLFYMPGFLRRMPLSDHRSHLKKNLVGGKQEGFVFDEIVIYKKFDEIFAKIGLNHQSPTIQLQASNRVRNKQEKKLKIRNLSTGIKTFLIIKTLLMNETIQQNGTIILDEPEIHLHPEWQLIFAELIVLLQKEFDMHILLNTHSPYFLEAIEVYSDFHGIADKCKYYLAENIDENNSVIRDTTDNTEPIYKKLARPFQELENVRYSHD